MAELNRAWATWASERAKRHPGSSVTYSVVPLKQGQSAELRPKALALMVAAGLILLIAWPILRD